MSENKKRGFFSKLGGAIDATRRWTLNIIFLVIVGGIAMAIFSSVQEVSVPDRAVLVLAPEGVVVDQLSAVDAFSQLSAQGLPQETLLADLIETVNLASEDPRIEILLLKLDDLDHIGMSKTLELSEAIQGFRENGKTIVATANHYNQDQYLLASFADQIFVHNMGGVGIEGFAVIRNYFREAIDKLNIRFHVFKVGNFKSAVEPLLRNDMSSAAKEANRAWLDQLWNLYRDTVVERRGISVSKFDEYVNHIDRVMAEVGGDAAQAALDYGLVDGIISRPMLRDMLIERVGENDEGSFQQSYFRDYLALNRSLLIEVKDSVGIIVASGNIVDGERPEGSIGGDSLARLIRKARLDKNIKALVLRIDSGGGSAFASEVIRAELQKLQEAGKPLVVSMGSMAASGGYWIAAGADEVWATPATLTGSIGIFGAFPTVDNMLQDLGVSTDGVGTTAVAGKLRPDLPLDPILASAIQSGVEYGYRRFINIVADGRNKLVEQVEPIAEGRVWSGIDAQQLGLVDKLGGLQQAINSAASLAGLDPADTRLLSLPLSPEEELMRMILGSGLVKSALSASSPLVSVLNSVLPAWRDVLALKDSRGVYAYCLMCVAP
ncbi:signal peptide peptidase SppA [Zhongshania marina]|uniref:Signal peptide peptidase SppA n=1 Tax=Zhongshania marina TaxID=2304603 RepID=A0A2S4HE34_9GAMM|nr:signal peptide peptidase SppA [Marortus luteolus]POP52253.1 signal peptide peptidase SppA [Marortus luteolus]